MLHSPLKAALGVPHLVGSGFVVGEVMSDGMRDLGKNQIFRSELVISVA